MPRLTLLLTLLLLPACTRSPEPLLICGADEVFEIDAAAPTPAKRWTWKAKDHPDLPEPFRKLFNTTDDCKPLDLVDPARGGQLLITSSGGGCALVHRPTGRVLWYARVPNAHSIELLPADRVIVASSTNANGNRLVLFDLAKPDHPVFETELHSAHGVVWDATRQRLYALGFSELRAYKLQNWNTAKPALALDQSHPLPDNGGHDLQPIPRSHQLILTTHHGVHLFNRATQTFQPHPTLGHHPNVKCTSPHPTTNQLLHLQAQGKNWWTDTIHLQNPHQQITLQDHRLYKARWLPPPQGP